MGLICSQEARLTGEQAVEAEVRKSGLKRKKDTGWEKAGVPCRSGL